MSNTGNIDGVTRRLGDIRRRNRPNQRRNHNHVPSRGTPETSQVPVASRISTSASQSSPSNPNAESRSMHGQRGALQEASAVTVQISLQRESVALGDREPISNELPIEDTSRVRIEVLESEVHQLHTRIDQLQIRVYQLQTSIAEPPTRIEHIQASVNLFLIRINQLKSRVEQLQGCIDQLPTRITQLQPHFSPFPSNFESLQGRMYQLRVRVDHLKSRIELLQTRIDQMPSHLNGLQTRVEHLQQALLVLQDETNANRATPNNRPTLFPDFPPPILERPRLNAILATYQNKVCQMRKTAIENLLQSVDGSWENIDPCFCGDSYALVTAAEESHAPARMPKCGHVFGRPCIALWLKEQNTCPLCRDEVYLPSTEREYLMGYR
ncbi:24b6f712-64f1-42b1-8677-9b9c6ba83a3f-CDS [Sclerotinia trifoliorum]|uniref:24b6f712-64f1-42b1-8677-9b9c6ba83a3f-CDS n=1 Tax=Sclerotinia trifoliorum TaxID=28548 RepID=A0A8H2VXI7_9HELO|nr:24b6f712-64f1-42b1-8677-9b9c6ba83a3f-CDS [Sclerotinia trifoliorum]